MKTSAQTLPRKLPSQARAEATVGAILEAAARILESQGLDGFNTNRVAEVAGVSVGSLYQYFPHKHALVAALSERAMRHRVAALRGAVAKARGKPLAHGVRALVRAAVEQQFEAPRLANALDYMERQLPLAEQQSALQSELLLVLVGFLAEHRGEVRGELATVARDLQTIAKALIDGAAAAGETNLPALRKRLERAALAYLVSG